MQSTTYRFNSWRDVSSNPPFDCSDQKEYLECLSNGERNVVPKPKKWRALKKSNNLKSKPLRRASHRLVRIGQRIKMSFI